MGINLRTKKPIPAAKIAEIAIATNAEGIPGPIISPINVYLLILAINLVPWGPKSFEFLNFSI